MSEPNAPFILDDVSTATSNTPSFPQTHRRKPLDVIFKCLIVVSLVANSVLVTLVVLRWSPKESHVGHLSGNPIPSGQFGEADGRVCFTCDYLGPEITSRDTVYDVVRTATGNTMCCLRGHGDVAKLFRRILQDRFGHSPAVLRSWMPSSFQRNNAKGAHLYLKVTGSTPQWRSTGRDTYNTAFCSGVICQGGNITIEEAGKYFVYSHITLNNDIGLQIDYNLLHIIYRKNSHFPGIGEKKLLFSKTSSEGPRPKVSSMSAILNLRKSDVLRVVVSKDYLPVLEKGRFSNFFGVMKV